MSLLSRLRRSRALLRHALSLPRRPGARIVRAEPCYRLVDRLEARSVALDCGLGNDADFSVALIRRYGLHVHGVDPTVRHHPSLERVARSLEGRFRLWKRAIGARNGPVVFHESVNNVSGSLAPEHRNVRRDTIRRYEVEAVTLERAIIDLAGGDVSLVKLDIEGTEYDALEATADAVLRSVPQWIVEFHHDVVEGLSFAATRRAVRRFRSLGFTSSTLDEVNWLFFLP